MSEVNDDLLDELLKTSPDETLDEFVEENHILEPLLPEINLIIDQGIRFFVRAMLLAANEKTFWEGPSSVTGKYHPPDEAGLGGNVLHTKRVTRLVVLMVDAQAREQVECDMAIASALLHDLTKIIEWNDGSIHYDEMHPYTVERIFHQLRTKESPEEILSRSTTLLCEDTTCFEILRAIRCHMGPWSPIPETIPSAALEWVLHFADNIATHLANVVDGEDINMKRWALE